MKKKLSDKRGFTLAELLIVVAIIAVLAAIAIPVFNAQLEKARQGTDLANLRAAYAEAAVAALDSADYVGTSTSTVTLTSNGKFDKLTEAKVGTYDLNTNNLAAGTYYVHVKGESGTTQKVAIDTSSATSATTVWK